MDHANRLQEFTLSVTRLAVVRRRFIRFRIPNGQRGGLLSRIAFAHPLCNQCFLNTTFLVCEGSCFCHARSPQGDGN